jgi:hypothetical protein
MGRGEPKNRKARTPMRTDEASKMAASRNNHAVTMEPWRAPRTLLKKHQGRFRAAILSQRSRLKNGGERGPTRQ